MGDASFQWIGDSPKDSGPLPGAVAWFCRKVFRLGLVLQVSKSGFVASTARAAAKLVPLARVMKLRGRKHMRNLGHEVFSGRPLKGMEQARLNKLLKRRPKLRPFEGAPRLKMARSGGQVFCQRGPTGLE
eukprot:9489060-Pyramimonas_sp.AAC.1